MYFDFVMWFYSLSTETKIISMQLILLFGEVIYFFWLRNFLKKWEYEIGRGKTNN